MKTIIHIKNTNIEEKHQKPWKLANYLKSYKRESTKIIWCQRWGNICFQYFLSGLEILSIRRKAPNNEPIKLVSSCAFLFKETSGKRSLSLSNVAGVFYILIGGLVLAVLFGACEVSFKRLQLVPKVKLSDIYTHHFFF